MTRAFVAIGSNLGDRLAHLQAAVDGLAATEGVTVVSVSPVFETDPIGPEQPDYFNAVVEIDTVLDPHALLRLCLALEDAEGRVRVERWGARTLDCDVLLFGSETIETPDLVVPHPRMWERGFVLVPLAAIAPDVIQVDGPIPSEGVRPTEVALRTP